MSRDTGGPVHHTGGRGQLDGGSCKVPASIKIPVRTLGWGACEASTTTYPQHQLQLNLHLQWVHAPALPVKKNMLLLGAFIMTHFIHFYCIYYIVFPCITNA